MEEGKLFLSVTVLYCHNYLIFFSRRSFFRLSDLKKNPFRLPTMATRETFPQFP